MDIEKFINENTMLNEMPAQLFNKSRLIQLLDKYAKALQLQQTGVSGSAWIEVLSDHELSEYAEKLEPIWIILEDDEDKKPILAQPDGDDNFYGDDGNIYHYCDISHFMKIERPVF